MREKIKHILTLVGLWDKKNTIVGNADKKYLSGGERKRLNVALELLLDPTIIVLDEPTSGLSSKDSEKLIEILDELKLQGKIIIATIHQPNADLFQRFDKLLLLDRGGIQVYFGSTKDIFSYFDDELEKITQYDEQVSSKEISSVVMLMQKKKFLMPEYIFDLLEYSHYSGLSGFTERFFTPLYWKEKYRKNQLYEIFHYQNAHEYDYNSSDKTEIIKERFEFIKCLFRVHYMFLRNMINKLSNRTNIIITFIASPLLALVIAFILRYADIENTSDYSFYHNPNVVLFMFISVIVFIFLGMANSINEIIPERRILSREKKINVKDYEFLIVKFVLLCIISAIQASLFLLVSMPIIKINGMFIYYFIYLFLSAVSGNSIGLLLSGALNDRESVTNLLPYLLIPQILFAGAVIPFAEMNNYIKICEKAAVPEFCNIIPSRWLFEGIAVSQASNNYYDLKLNKIYDDIKKTDDSSQKTKYYRELNNFLKKSNKEDYINLKLMNWVNMQNGRAYNTNKYQFMSTNRYIKSKTIPVSSFNVYIIVFFNMILGVLTLIALKRKKEN